MIFVLNRIDTLNATFENEIRANKTANNHGQELQKIL